MEHIDRRWHLSTGNTSRSAVNKEVPEEIEEDTVVIKLSLYALLNKLKLKSRQCENSSNQISYLEEDLVKKVIANSEVRVEDRSIDSSAPENRFLCQLQMMTIRWVVLQKKPVIVQHGKSSRAKKKKGRAEQTAAKVTDGEVKIA